LESYLEFRDLTKTFPGVTALDRVSFGVSRATIHGLVGENGAGKSTLLKILSGAFRPTAGDLLIGGKKKIFTRTRDALKAGIAVIYQELNLVPEMTVAENLLLGQWPRRFILLNKKEMTHRAESQIRDLLEDMDPGGKVRHLPIGQRQMIEIGKALLHDAGVIAFDEPTSSLSRKETGRLFEIIKTLRRRGRTVLYVSHRLEEIFSLCDAVTVFRDGRRIETFTDMKEVTPDLLIRRMVGREIRDIYDYRPRNGGEPLLEVKNLRGPGLKGDISFSVARGEILGIFGLGGAGRTELLKLIFGAEKPAAGEISVAGRTVVIGSPVSAIRHGLCLCPEDRKTEGILAEASVNENINISCRRHFLKAGIFLDKRKERENAGRLIVRLKIHTPSGEETMGNLSGGNQQKAVLARWLSENMAVFLLDEPTRGIDVGAKHEIYRIMYRLAEEGKSVIFASSDLPEVMGVADRILVMRNGGIAGKVARQDASEERLLSMALPAG